MKNILFISALAFAAEASAQSYRSYSRPTDFTIGVGYSDVSHDVIDYNGYTLSGKYAIARDFFLTASFTDASTGRVENAEYDLALRLDVRQWSLGFESDISAGPGKFNLSFAMANSVLKGFLDDGVAGVLYEGDVIKNQQFAFGVRYDLEIGRSFVIGFGVTHFANDFKFIGGLSSLGPIEDKSVTAPSVSFGFIPTQNFSLHLTYSTEDTLLGVPEADGTISLVAKVHF